MVVRIGIGLSEEPLLAWLPVREDPMKSTCELYDDYLETIGTLPPILRHYGGKHRFHGPVQTVKCFEDNSKVKALAEGPGNGCIMVIDAGSSVRHALVGDLVAGAAQSNGWAGIIIMGAIRDSAAIKDLDIGVMALATTPRKSIRNNEGQIGLSIRIGDIRVESGDYVVADEDGALCFPKTGPMPPLG